MGESYRRPRKKQSTAVDTRFEAQKLAFAPLSFQAALALRDLKILNVLEEASSQGISFQNLSATLSLSEYCLRTLLEVGGNLGIVELLENENYLLTKLGSFLLNDEMTKINMNFVNDICYQGAFYLKEAFLNSEPVGLKVFGEWPVIYEGLSQLPQKAQESWFAFDHYYSDIAFPEALPIVFAGKPKNIFDIGGNTGKWTLECLKYDSEVKLHIFDLSGQLEKAKINLQNEGLESRVNLHSLNVLEPSSKLPGGADAVWMSQFLDCFSKEQIVSILSKVKEAIDDQCSVYILEPFWDKQKYQAAAFSLNHTSLYFTCMANGKSKMYSFNEMLSCINLAGLKLQEVHDDIGEHSYTLLRCSK